MEARQEAEWIRHKSGPIGGKIDRAAQTSRAAMRPNSVILKSSHLSGFNRGLERFQSFPDLLNLVPDQSDVFGRHTRSG